MANGTRLPAAELLAAIAAWRGEGLVDGWFFVRKPPGLRLRLRGPRSALGLQPRLYAWLEAAEERRLIRGFRPAIYEPERYRFGGAAGMAIAHDLFERDSEWALRRAAADAEGEGDLGPRWLVSAMILSDLLVQVLSDGAEIWDVWKRLEARLGGDLPPRRLAERELAALCFDPGLLAALPPARVALLDAVRAGNAAVAAALRAACLAGMSVGPRAWLATAAIFHGNRHGLGIDGLRAMTAAMTAAFDPGDGAP